MNATTETLETPVHRYWPALLGTIAWFVATAALWVYLGNSPAGCSRLQSGAWFAGSTDRFNDYVLGNRHPGSGCSRAPLGAARLDVLLGIVVAVVVGVSLFLLLAWWLRRGVFTQRARTWVWRATFLPLAAAALNIVANILTIVGLYRTQVAGAPSLRLRHWTAVVLPVFAWQQLVFFTVAILVLVLEMVAARGTGMLVRGAPPDPEAEPSPRVPRLLGRTRRFVHAHQHWLEQPEAPMPPVEVPPPIAGLGICCSGGGIRAAAISLGVLSSLESHRPDGSLIASREFDGHSSILDRASFISSVSGGGYAAGAWRIARGPKKQEGHDRFDQGLWPAGIVGDPWDGAKAPPEAFDSDVAPGDPTLFRHIRARREYLRTGRGGLATSVARAVLSLAFQLALLVGVIVLVAWPVGRLSRSWYVYGGIGCRSFAGSPRPPVNPVLHGDLGTGVCGETRPKDHCVLPTNDPALTHSLTRTRCFLDRVGVQMPITWSLTAAPIALGGIGLCVFLGTLAAMRTRRRRTLRLVALALGSTAGALAIVLIGIPVLIDAAFPYVTTRLGIGLLASAASAGGVTAIVLRFLRTEFGRRIDLFGKALVGVAAVLFGVVVAGQAATAEGLFALDWSGPFAGWPAYLLVAGGMLLAFLFLDPRCWSLHVIYRNRLRNTFSTTRDKSVARRSVILKSVLMGTPRLLPLAGSKEPTLEKYREAEGPTHLVCCSAARNTKAVTGIPALSFVFSPDEVTLYEPHYANQTVTIQSHTVTADDYVRALGRHSSRHAKGNVSATVAMSGAAVGSAMGRFDPREPTSLFAVLNLRLGVWMPNPSLIDPRVRGVPKTRLSYLIKEIVGYFEVDDRHLYISDGGHRENLGLVELLRRRCLTMICIDASGDAPGSYTTLRQAAETAAVEVGATIDLASLPVAPPPGTVPPMPRVAYTVLGVRYDEGGVGTIVHLSAEMYAECLLGLRAFNDEDPEFPHYSTGNQFLSDAQFSNLVKLGRAISDTAIASDEVVIAVQAATSS